MTDAVILLAKPPGLSSFSALAEVKRRLATRRVGHAGTLDPFAEGLLIALSGSYTRLAPWASAMDKEYLAVFTFGRTTDTLDPEGRFTAEGSVPSRESLQEALPAFTGTISQVPPAFSAVHVGGRRAYEAARSGQELTLAPRQVTVHGLSLLGFTGAEASLRIGCSRGTYVRSLARDIAAHLGTVAYVRRLERTRIGGFRVEEAVSPGDFDPSRHLLDGARFVGAASGLGSLVLREEWVSRAASGRPLVDGSFQETAGADGTFAAFTPAGELLALARRDGGAWSYAAVFSRGSAA